MNIISLHASIDNCFIVPKNSKTEIFLSTLNFKHCASLRTILDIFICFRQSLLVTASSTTCVRAWKGCCARTTPGGQNKPPLGRVVKAKAVDGSQTATTVNPFRLNKRKIDRDTSQRGQTNTKINFVGTEVARSAKQQQ